MSSSGEILSAIESAFQRKDFESRDSIVRLNEAGNYVFEWGDSKVTVKGSWSEHDSIGFLLKRIEVSKNVAENIDVGEYLKSVARAIETRVNYLMEPLKIIELDSTTNSVQMRSEKPERQDGQLSYFEVVLKAGKWFGHRNHATFQRYAHREEQEATREPVPFAVTRKQFQKLIDDLIEIL